MDPIEKAIRNALEKGNALDPAFRQRVYVSAEHALSRSLAAHATMAPAERHQRIERLRKVAQGIENEFAPAEPVVPERLVPRQSQAPHSQPVRQPDFVPAPAHRSGSVEPTRPSARAGRRPRVSGTMRLFVWLTFLALAIMLAWLVWTSGIIKTSGVDSSGTVKVQEEESSSGTAAPRAGIPSPEQEGWITLFQPADAGSLEVGSGMSADLKGAGDDAYVELRGPDNGKADDAITFEVGRGILENLRGKRVVFDVVARAADGNGVQMSVGCDLAGMGECQRTRIRLESQASDNLIVVQLADTDPEASGSLSVIPDVEGKGRPIEVIAIRVRPEAPQG